jgi:hypothetical protein
MASYCYCTSDDLGIGGYPEAFPPKNSRTVELSAVDLGKIPGAPIAYWASRTIRDIFSSNRLIDDIADVRQGLRTGDNERFLRSWYEISAERIGFDFDSIEAAHKTEFKWFPYNKGGSYRKWYGNNEFVIAFDRASFAALGQQGNKLPSKQYYFRPSITWTGISSGDFSARYSPVGFSFDGTGSCLFSRGEPSVEYFGALLNSKIAACFLEIISSTVSFEVGHLKRIPVIEESVSSLEILAKEAIAIAKSDWDSFEVSWNFESLQLVRPRLQSDGLVQAWEDWRRTTLSRISRMTGVEVEINRLLIDIYGLKDEIAPDVSDDQITLARADREKDCQRLISYAIGCMMGRYSLDEPGLIYAHAGNVGFDPSRYEKKFPADADGIVPITDEHWFEVDAASRVREFLRAVWGADTLEENMAWLAESLGTKGSETPDETIRRYLADRFFKDHLQNYKKRPIYWLFSSGKQGAFQALVYLHRYHEGTLARLRAEYLLPLTGKMQARIESLQADLRAATSTAARTKLNKQLEALKKQQLELLAYDEKLRHHADMRISLDLDDGVKVNYGKFGDLLSEVKAVTGGAADE